MKKIILSFLCLWFCIATQEVFAQKYFKSRIYEAKEEALSSESEEGTDEKGASKPTEEDYVKVDGKKYKYIYGLDSSLIGKKVTYKNGYYLIGNPRIAMNNRTLGLYAKVMGCKGVGGADGKSSVVTWSTGIVGAAGALTGIYLYYDMKKQDNNGIAPDLNTVDYVIMGGGGFAVMALSLYIGDLWEDKIYANAAKKYNACSKDYGKKSRKKKATAFLPSRIQLAPTLQGGGVVGLGWSF